ncbi:LysR family transcriptional regulator [Alteromonadaceae bacterium M269]|nr:LysR family transcriptional regulator [Alteromonadaceae bacterium M269]
MFQHALLNEVIAFIAVAEHRSFTLAAESLRSTKSSTGKAVKKLEDQLGLKLFNRTTRTVRLTEEGKIFFDAAKQAIETINQAKLQLDARKDEPVGHLRVNLPLGVGRTIINALPLFTQANPKVTTELSLTDKFEGAVQGEWDIVVRIGLLDDSGFIAKKLCHLKRVLCASPEYMSRKGAPKSLLELQEHDAIAFRAPSGRIRPWIFQDASNEIIEVIPPASVTVADGRSLVDAVMSGAGIAQVYDKALGEALQRGHLIELFPDMAPGAAPLNALIPSGRDMPAKTRAFIEFLVELFNSHPMK